VLRNFGTPGIGGGVDKNEAAAITGSTPKEVASAFHQAKDDSEGFWGVPRDRHKK